MIIPGFTKYDLSTDGVVTKIATGKIIKPQIMRVRSHVYKVVYLHDDADNAIHACSVMRLLALTYIGEPEVSSVAKAIDGDNLNTVVDNVAWVPYANHVKESWDAGKMAHRTPRQSACSADAIAMVRETMKAYDRPVSMAELSAELQVPYAIVRYAMLALRERGIARKTKEGFEVIR